MINWFVTESRFRFVNFPAVRDDSEDSILPSSSNIYPRFILILFHTDSVLFYYTKTAVELPRLLRILRI